MYLADSYRRIVESFEYDLATGRISGRREFYRAGEDDGLPDGLAVDSDGGVWVAHWGGWAVRRIAQDGTTDAVVELPVSHVASCAFGGDGLEQLYITTAWYGLADRGREQQPLAGSLFVVGDVGVSGAPVGHLRGL